jgi:hypothetical protein
VVVYFQHHYDDEYIPYFHLFPFESHCLSSIIIISLFQINFFVRIGTRAQYEMTALMWAAYNGHADCVRLLMEVGADKEARDKVRGWFQLPRLRMSQCFIDTLVMVSADIFIFGVSLQLLLSCFLRRRVNLLRDSVWFCW